MPRTLPVFPLLAMLAMLPLLSSASDQPPVRTPKQEAERLSLDAGLARAILERYDKATDVFEGTVVKVGKAPGFWCGRLPAFQDVTVRLEQVLKGNAVPRSWLEPEEVTVSYYILKAGGICGQEPALNAELFAVGKRLMVFAKAGDSLAPKTATAGLTGEGFALGMQGGEVAGTP